MTLQTYQSQLVLRTLKSGKTYRAKPNLKLRGEYAALIDLLGLHCECPVFAVGKGQAAEHRGPGVRLGAPHPGGARRPGAPYRVRRVGGLFVCLQIYKAGELPPCRRTVRRSPCGATTRSSPTCAASGPSPNTTAPRRVLEKIDPAWLKEVKIPKDTIFTSWGT